MTTCVDSLGRTDIVIDETECTTTCTMLERDGEGAKHVQTHAECARNAADCEALLACL